jgi:hypothetical protein
MAKEKKQLSNNLTLGYSGDIKLSTYLGGKLISTKQYHNAGALNLYRFFANCLVGNYSFASPLRPFKIKLFKYKNAATSGGTGILPDEFNLTTALSDNSLVEASDFLDVMSAPEIFYMDDGNTVGCKVKLSFTFPYNFIIGTGQAAHLVAIYGINTEKKEDLSAYYLLTKEVYDLNADGLISKSTTQWDPIIKLPDEEETNRILAVEWTMTLANNIK